MAVEMYSFYSPGALSGNRINMRSQYCTTVVGCRDNSAFVVLEADEGERERERERDRIRRCY